MTAINTIRGSERRASDDEGGTRPTWQLQAACRSFPVDLFFTVGTSDVARFDQERAKEVCAICPVQAECLEFALDSDEQFGVWGGLTPDERRALGASRHAS